MITKYCLTCIFLCVTFLIKAQENELAYAQALYEQGKFFESSVSYERVLFESNETSTRYEAIVGKLNCLKQQQRFSEALLFLAGNFNNEMPDTMKAAILYEQALCSYLAGNFENTISLSEQMDNLYPDYKTISYLHLYKILSLNELQRWQEAEEETKLFLKKYTNADTATNLYDKLPKLKSESKTQWLSTFIPGAGQMYAGKPWEGIATILLQGGAIYFGIVSWQQKYYISAVLVGAGMFGSFHNGGVRRSEILVKQYNRKKVIAFNEKLREELIGIMNVSLKSSE